MFFANLFRKSELSKELEELKKLNEEETLKEEVDKLNEEHKIYCNTLCYDRDDNKIWMFIGFIVVDGEVCIKKYYSYNIEESTYSYTRVNSIKSSHYMSVGNYLLSHRTNWIKLKNQLKVFNLEVKKINNESK